MRVAGPAIEALVQTIEFLPVADAPEYLRNAIRRRAASLHAMTPAAADAEQLIADVDIDRIIYLVGTARRALEMVAACAVELGTTARMIERELRRIDLRPVATHPTQPHLGVDIAFIVAFRALTREQRWLLHTLAIWAESPATIAREYALVVARGSGQYAQLMVTPDDLARLIALGFVMPIAISTRTPEGLATGGRLTMEPYLRFIAAQGLAEWPIPDVDPSVTAEVVLASVLVHWAVSFAEIIAGPDMTPPPEPADEQMGEDDAAEQRLLTPDPALAELTGDEAWMALRPEAPHILLAARLAREFGADDYVYRLCQLLPGRLRGRSEPEARSFRRVLLEEALLCARAAKAPREIMLLATQLADVALDANELDRANLFAGEALTAALATSDLRAVAFAARRQSAIALRNGDVPLAQQTARQAIATARAVDDPAAMREGIALLEAATLLAHP